MRSDFSLNTINTTSKEELSWLGIIRLVVVFVQDDVARG